jgi:hypothetical protein
MELKKCEFTHPVEGQTSAGIQVGMSREDVGFWFEVDVDTAEKKDLEFMLRAFDQVAADFKKAWQSRLKKFR